MQPSRTIAYFSMEVGLEAGIPTYSGGLGILAGDTIRAAADLKVPMVAVTLLYRKGYFYQRLEPDGWQREEPVEWAVDDFLQEQPQRVSVTVEGRTVQLRCWKYDVSGVTGFMVPVYFLDTDLSENAEWDRTLTHVLYGGDQRYRLCQEVVLGTGGVRMLRALGYDSIERFHMNEGHASLLTLELLDEKARAANRTTLTHDDIDAVRQQCLFTTHTLIPAGHDQFPLDLVGRVLGRRELFVDKHDVFCCEGLLNMTYLALNLSHYVNGVAKKHGEESSVMFAGYVIDSITNGVHAATWVADPFQKLYDHYVPGWRQDNFNLRYALSIPKQEVWQAHTHAKKRLIQYVNHETNVGMDVDVLTLGFARRATTYKRADLLFADPQRLKGIAAKAGGLQVIYGGKAHPRDQGGKELIKRVFQAKESLKRDIKIAYLENYDMDLAKMMIAGVDVWLNTPQPPLEASGTSGMKAALNGVPSFSVLDGWWIEGRIEGVTGWAIGEDGPGTGGGGERSKVVSSLYDKLEQIISPLFYRNRDRFLDVMLHAIALNGSFFNTHRMVLQYVLKAYL
ncbi:MAG: alpha-glucan family phosphorylase [Deltaproteobacteria bacterium]|nr:alpha-glucan family phosphorylase [Deltaproteobacteria bacterium]